jgi:hypothetical protein
MFEEKGQVKLGKLIKKLFFAVVLSITIMGAAAVGSANSAINDELISKQTKASSQFIVTITRPDSDESTFRNSYIISGNTKKNNIKVKLLLLNKTSDKYELFENDEGESSWIIGTSGVFMKEVELPVEGSYAIRIVAFNKFDENNLVLGKTLQVSDFNISLLNKNIKDKIKSKMSRFIDFTNMLHRLFD